MKDATPKKIERKPLIFPFMNELAKSSLIGIDLSFGPGHESYRSGDLSHSFNQPINLFIRRVTGASGAQQPLLLLAEPFNHRLGVKITFRGEDAPFGQFPGDFD